MRRAGSDKDGQVAMGDVRPESPRLQTLQDRQEGDGMAALTAFWEQVEAAGAPLIEPLRTTAAPT
jgi:hypothetical protein